MFTISLKIIFLMMALSTSIQNVRIKHSNKCLATNVEKIPYTWDELYWLFTQIVSFITIFFFIL